MLRFLLDTDHLTLYYHRHQHLLHRMAVQRPDAVGVSAVTAEETLRGRLGALSQARRGSLRIVRYSLLLESLDFLTQFPLVPYDQASENHFQQLLSFRLRVGTQDLKIAAVALANNVTLLISTLPLLRVCERILVLGRKKLTASPRCQAV